MAAAAALTMLLFSFEPASCFQFTSSPLLVKQPQHPSPGWNANRRRVVTAGLKQWKEEAEKTGKKELAVLPFEVPELLLPGQTRYLHFYEDRFVRLGEKAQNEHQGMLAMAFFSGSEGAMLRVCTLVQIDEYSKLDVGIGLTVRGVGRCNIDNIVGMDDFILADVSLYGDEAEEGEKNEPGHDGSAAQLAAAWTRFHVQNKLKIVVSFYLIATQVEKIYDVEMPYDVRAMFDFFSVTVSFGLVKVTTAGHTPHTRTPKCHDMPRAAPQRSYVCNRRGCTRSPAARGSRPSSRLTAPAALLQ